MAKLLASLFLLSCAAGIAVAAKTITVEGRVYCDTCRAGFETSTTEYIKGAKVKIECTNYTTLEITHSGEGTTDDSGTYRIKMAETEEEEVCEVVLVSSPRKDCTEVNAGRDRAPVLLVRDSGMSSDVRYANSLGFFIDAPLNKCGQLLQQYALSDELA